jgi:ribonuclease HI
MNHIDVFADGSCLDNGKPSAKGGWSIVVTPPESTEVIVSDMGKLRRGKQTNNRAELETMYQALLWIEAHGDKNTFYSIFSDSATVVDGMSGVAGRNANRDLWEDVEEISERLIGRFTVMYVEGHLTDSPLPRHKNNCYADKLAKQAANSLLLAPFEPIKKGMVV